MRLLLLNDDFPPAGKGGAATVTHNLARGFAAAGHDVHVLTTHQDGPAVRVQDAAGVRVTSLPIAYRPALRPYLSLWNPAASRHVRDFFAESGRFDAVFAHNVHGYLSYAALGIAARHAGTVTATFHDVMSFSYGRLATKRYLAGTPGTFDHRVYAADHIAQAGLAWNPLRNSLIRRSLGAAGVRVAVSEALKTALLQNGVPCDTVIHNGIDPAAVTPSVQAVEAFRTRLGLNGPTVFFGGRLSGDKGFPELLRAMREVRKKVPQAALLLVGDAGRARGMLQGVTPDDHVIQTGWLGREELMCALAACDLCATPSMCFDSFPTVNLEAMALGKPVIATWYGGSSELVQEGVTGFIVNPADTAALAARIATLLTDPVRGAAMGQAGRRRIDADFTLAKQVQAYLALAGR